MSLKHWIPLVIGPAFSAISHPIGPESLELNALIDSYL